MFLGVSNLSDTRATKPLSASIAIRYLSAVRGEYEAYPQWGLRGGLLSALHFLSFLFFHFLHIFTFDVWMRATWDMYQQDLQGS